MVFSLFISFAPADEELCRALEAHLHPLVRSGRLVVWHRGKLTSGEEEEAVSSERLLSSQIVCPILTAAYFADERCHREMRDAAAARNLMDMRVVPILGSACSWEMSPLGSLRPAPSNRIPIKSWPSVAEALDAVARDIQSVLSKSEVEVTGQMPALSLGVAPSSRSSNEPPTVSGNNRDLENRFREALAQKNWADAAADSVPSDPETEGITGPGWPAGAEAVLVMVDAPDPAMRGKLFALNGDERSFGRSRKNDIILEGTAVSRMHARMERRMGEWRLYDLGSRNGTGRDGVPVQDSAVLRGGEWITIGPYTMRFLCGRDVHEQLQREIRLVAVTDGLTGIYNRNHFLDIVTHGMAQAKRDHGSVALVVFDIDNFEAVNRAHGRAAGNELLKRITAVTLHSLVDQARSMARLTGDMFAVLLAGDGRREAAMEIAERLRQQVEGHPFVVFGERVHLTISVGVVCADSGSVDADGLLSRADKLVRSAKRAGKNRIAI